MASEIKVTFAAIEQAAADIDGSRARMLAQLDDLKQSLAPVVGTWTGDAAARYTDAQRRWDTSAAELTETLQKIKMLVGQAGEGYRAVEMNNARRFSA
ncbi:WXG100 family type VII secretion target [Pseudonocardia sp. HH130630-07]|uniref:WXG100 family type VII secretion target n=1 Tax=Pseudonocardia sp. HH130630-07 TaxID=1690815 RepID=UPI000814CB87|nr:WXG100 family type VII secretion target [Pseudonocardia sp. HH130630-07]ANY07443.1 secretion protein [Pseudonocardia sp. HH130630-07]